MFSYKVQGIPYYFPIFVFDFIKTPLLITYVLTYARGLMKFRIKPPKNSCKYYHGYTQMVSLLIILKIYFGITNEVREETIILFDPHVCINHKKHG